MNGGYRSINNFKKRVKERGVSAAGVGAQRENKYLRLNTQHSKSGAINNNLNWNYQSEKSFENHNINRPSDVVTRACPEFEYQNMQKYTSLTSAVNDKNTGSQSRNETTNNM